MDTAQYLDAFLAETEENLNILNELCLVLESQGADDDTFAAMFRAAHTLKGMSATMGFQKMADLTHHMEDALGFFRQNPQRFDNSVIDVLFQAIDGLTAHVEAVRAGLGEDAINHGDILAALAQALSNDTPSQNPATSVGQFAEDALSMLQSLEQQGHEVAVVAVTLESECVMKGVRMVMVMRAMEQFADCVATAPDVSVLEEGAFEGAAQFAVVIHSGSRDQLRTAAAEIAEVERVDILLLGELAQTSRVAEKPPLREADAPVPSAEVSQAKQAAPKVREQTLRVPVGRIDEFMNVLSELVIAKTRLELLARSYDDQSLHDVSEQIARLSDSLQDGVMSMRMMPVESLFQRFPRMMRDLQKSLDREFDFEMTGLETEMDRTVMDEMGEALVHLLRNAADHGLESPDERVRRGKPRRGTIRLAAYASGGHVYLEVGDDGRGIDREKVLASAVKKGIVDPAKASTLSDAQVYDLLFASGFSTAAAVSDISGRGVGLDAVRGKVESLGGTIRIESVKGEGSTFLIELPLTLTILQAMLVKVGDELFALPTSNIEEVARLTAADIQFVHERPVLNFREKVVPIVDLGEYFFSSKTSGEETRQTVICREGKRYLALTVDDVIDELEVVNKPLGKYLESAKMFSGATILGDGHVALIVDLHQFFQIGA
ncbi:chemotaxis protein CheA [Alicyclobacillus fastidiosus]|uniref:Chemotaxis protein CheA n=1 Tax=Alicyclobacillus fastidiosus TaxID=392011 RepID=A0ABY6ZCE8_9BACL|nr:chemotaxis protein CheA [Alicyclobacillus fastidiosus]WAH40192.1 chemotaxis protein CheA [Alicyclobacillus fastidiosus]GMA61546.1 chemotaxis protein CheA [Alicyclobacillus fastidiosus]